MADYTLTISLSTRVTNLLRDKCGRDLNLPSPTAAQVRAWFLSTLRNQAIQLAISEYFDQQTAARNAADETATGTLPGEVTAT